MWRARSSGWRSRCWSTRATSSSRRRHRCATSWPASRPGCSAPTATTTWPEPSAGGGVYRGDSQAQTVSPDGYPPGQYNAERNSQLLRYTRRKQSGTCEEGDPSQGLGRVEKGFERQGPASRTTTVKPTFQELAMRLTTKGRFAVTAMIDLALRQNNGPVTL